MNREEMIDWLVENDIETATWNWAILLRVGFVGYNNFTDNELRAEILERDPDEVLGD